MLGIGSGELFIILIVAMIFIDPKDIPKITRSIGRVFAEFKRASNEVKTTLTSLEKDVTREINSVMPRDTKINILPSTSITSEKPSELKKPSEIPTNLPPSNEEKKS